MIRSVYSALVWLVLLPVHVYRAVLSPLKRGPSCRYLPTCSDYAMDAIRQHGAWAGFWLGLARVSRCHPWGGDGFDPVPPDFPRHDWRAWRHVMWRQK